MAKDGIKALRELRQLMNQSLDVTEIRQLCMDLGVDYEYLAGGEKRGKIDSLVIHLGHRGRLVELRNVLEAARPHHDWPKVPNTLPQDWTLEDLPGVRSANYPGCLVSAFWVSGVFTILAGFGIFGYIVIRFLDTVFNALVVSNPRAVDLASIPFNLLPVGAGLMFVGFIIFALGVATGIFKGIRRRKRKTI